MALGRLRRVEGVLLMKLCKDCKHFRVSDHFKWVPIAGWLWRRNHGERFATCAATITWSDKDENYCSVERKYGSCGVHGKNWEPRT